jgi:hypothetical protein
MRICSFVHKGVKRLYADNDAKGVPPESVDKLKKMFAFPDAMQATNCGRLPCGKFTHCWATARPMEFKHYAQPPPDVPDR